MSTTFKHKRPSGVPKVLKGASALTTALTGHWTGGRAAVDLEKQKQSARGSIWEAVVCEKAKILCADLLEGIPG